MFRVVAAVLDSAVSVLAKLSLLFGLENEVDVVCRPGVEVVDASLFLTSFEAFGLDVIVVAHSSLSLVRPFKTISYQVIIA